MLVSSFAFTQNALVVIKQDTFALVTIASLKVDNILAAQCDSISSDNALNVELMDIQVNRISNLEADNADLAKMVENLVEIVKGKNELTKIDKTKIDNLTQQVKKEQRKTKIVAGTGIVLIILSLLL